MTAETQETPKQPDDLDLILPEGGIVEIDGIKARVKRLKTYEFLGLMRVITNGLGPSLGQHEWDTSDEEQLKADLVAMVITAMPNAAEEFIVFLRSVLEPVDPDQAAALALAMRNPDPIDSIDVIGVLVDQEAPDLSVLAGKARAWISKIQKTMRRTQPAAG